MTSEPFRERVARALYDLDLQDQVVAWDYDDPMQEVTRERYRRYADHFIKKTDACDRLKI
jgi:hypothetical protein